MRHVVKSGKAHDAYDPDPTGSQPADRSFLVQLRHGERVGEYEPIQKKHEDRSHDAQLEQKGGRGAHYEVLKQVVVASGELRSQIRMGGIAQSQSEGKMHRILGQILQRKLDCRAPAYHALRTP